MIFGNISRNVANIIINIINIIIIFIMLSHYHYSNYHHCHYSYAIINSQCYYVTALSILLIKRKMVKCSVDMLTNKVQPKKPGYISVSFIPH